MAQPPSSPTRLSSKSTASSALSRVNSFAMARPPTPAMLLLGDNKHAREMTQAQQPHAEVLAQTQ